jgi:hypothetical protein
MKERSAAEPPQCEYQVRAGMEPWDAGGLLVLGHSDGRRAEAIQGQSAGPNDSHRP